MNFKLWIQHDRNVLMVGRHGVGKTAMIQECWGQAGIKYMYFSAPTMDPWVDLIGIPKERIDEKSKKAYLDFVVPFELAMGDCEAMFFDEFNRAPPKVRNAVMELLQFKSINGRKMGKLRMIWAAVNPDGDELGYEVMKIDPAQKDRFHIQIGIPYEPHREFFEKKYGEQTAAAAISWWKNLDPVIQAEVSPRRLDYALEWHDLGGPISEVLPLTCNVNTLLTALDSGPVDKKLVRLMNDATKARDWVRIENNYASAISTILGHEKFFKFFVPMLPPEKLATVISQKIDDDKLMEQFIELCDTSESVAMGIGQLYRDAENQDFQNKILKHAHHSCVLQASMGVSFENWFKISHFHLENPDKLVPPESPIRASKGKTVDEVCDMTANTTEQRKKCLKAICQEFEFATLSTQDKDRLLTKLDQIIRHCHSKSLVTWAKDFGLIGFLNDVVTDGGKRVKDKVAVNGHTIGVTEEGVPDPIKAGQDYPYSYLDISQRFPHILHRIQFEQDLMVGLFCVHDHEEPTE